MLIWIKFAQGGLALVRDRQAEENGHRRGSDDGVVRAIMPRPAYRVSNANRPRLLLLPPRDYAPPMTTRRTILAGLVATAVAPALAQSLDAGQLEIVPNDADQSAALQDALLRAAAEGRPLFLPAGTYLCTNLQLPSDVVVEGIPGATILAASATDPVARISGNTDVTLRGLSFASGAGGPAEGERGLLEIEASDRITIERCGFAGGSANGMAVRDAAASIEGCSFASHAQAAIFSMDSRGLKIAGNTITDCGNGGILIWSSDTRRDGSIITGNSITRIDWRGGGNGQNGNGINVFRSAQVIIADNHIAGCAFTAVRLNSSRDCQVSGNICINSGEVAIFSEFGFSGSVIANNLIDGAATGISITNLDTGGQIAVCSGNLVRNITATSAVNPDTSGVGIYAEAETVISANTVHTVAGFGVIAGYGPFRRNIVVTGNTIAEVSVGIGVSLVDEPPSGPVSITNNQITGATDAAIVGMRWDDMADRDLAANAGSYPGVTVAGNQLG